MSRTLVAGMVIADKYEIVGELGEGGMGIVYEGRHLGLGRSVAIKTMLPRFTEHDTMLQRFKQEAQAASSIGHPHICDVFDFGELDDGTLFMVMERLQGEPLEDLIERDAPLDVRLAIDIATQALAALSAAHKRGIVHRDLKPENIFLCESDDDVPFVKLLDFGVSKVLRPLEFTAEPFPSVTKTHVGSVVGTPLYMAPEQASGAADVDQRADIWAMGSVLYQMLVGHTPFRGDSFHVILAAVVSEEIELPTSFRPDLPPAIVKIVMKALDKQRSTRTQDATTMRRELLALTGAIARKSPSPKLGATITLPPLPGDQPASKPTGWSHAPLAPALDRNALEALERGDLMALDGSEAVKAAPDTVFEPPPAEAFAPLQVAAPELELDLAVKLPSAKPAPPPVVSSGFSGATVLWLLLAAFVAVGILYRMGVFF